jgi:hypothetical protein
MVREEDTGTSKRYSQKGRRDIVVVAATELEVPSAIGAALRKHRIRSLMWEVRYIANS